MGLEGIVEAERRALLQRTWLKFEEPGQRAVHGSVKRRRVRYARFDSPYPAPLAPTSPAHASGSAAAVAREIVEVKEPGRSTRQADLEEPQPSTGSCLRMRMRPAMVLSTVVGLERGLPASVPQNFRTHCPFDVSRWAPSMALPH